MQSLACRFRPKEFEDCCGQSSIIKILNRQLELREFKNCYLFCGPSGTGKTTIARIFANKINQYNGSPIEIDGASNNGVENIRNIITMAKERSIDSEYKIFIIDECHMITTQAWNAFLKCIEEPPKYTIFLFCTTDPQKIPNTILNRVMRFNLTRVPTEQIKNRLMYVCNNEKYTNYVECCDYISKLACGGVRDSLALLEKAASYSTDLCITNVLQSLGNFSYETFFDLTYAIIDNDEQQIIKIINYCFNLGNDLKLFMNQFVDFVLDINKYALFNSLEVVKVPNSFENELKYCVTQRDSTFYHTLTSQLLTITNQLKSDTMPNTTITIKLLDISKGLSK